MLSELRFAAALVYSPRGQSAESKKSRVQVRDPLKRGDPRFLQFYESMRARLDLLDRPRRVTLIDDFVTRGATLLAAASRLQEALPGAEIRAFVLVRTMGLVAEIESIGAPCAGTIRCDGKVVERHP